MSAMPADRAQRALIRALQPSVAPFTVAAIQSRSWASATFEGTRHRLSLMLEGPDARGRGAALAARLPDAELTLPGAFVADLSASLDESGETPVLAIEALLIEDA